MAKQTTYIVTFNTADILTNVFTEEKEDYHFETDFNRPIYLRNYIVKIVESEYKTIEYDHFSMTIGIDGSEELTLRDYLRYRLYRNTSLENDIWHCPDTDETVTHTDMMNELKELGLMKNGTATAKIDD